MTPMRRGPGAFFLGHPVVLIYWSGAGVQLEQQLLPVVAPQVPFANDAADARTLPHQNYLHYGYHFIVTVGITAE